MSDIDFVVKKSKSLEARLERDFNASGRGLGEKIKSVEWKLPSNTIKQLYEVNDIRNDLVHKEKINSVPDRTEFKRKCKKIEKSLNKVKRANRPPEWEGGAMALAFAIAVVMIYLLL